MTPDDPVPPTDWPLPRYRQRLRHYGPAGLAAAVLFAACILGLVLPLPVRGIEGHGCNDVPTGFALRHYGVVAGCRQLRATTHVLDGRHPNVFLLLETETGLVALRIDYDQLDMGRQYVSQAQELTPGQAPGLSRSERDRLAADLAARGGHLDSWTLHYGDG